MKALFVVIASRKSNNKRIRAHFLPYVRNEDTQFQIWYRVMPGNAESVVSLSVGVECLDILEPIRYTDVIAQVSDEYEYKPLHFRVADHWPDWKGKGINMFWVEFIIPEPGFAITIDDVEVF